jgi:hypothetical protein
MNFLEIAKRVRQECGISGDGPAAVQSQVGISAKLVAWVQTAYEEIQSLQPWRYNWAEHTQALTAGVAVYAPVNDWGLDFRELATDPIYVYRTQDGPRSKHWLCHVSWAEMRDMAQVGIQGVPVYCAMRPDTTIQFHPEPQDGLTAVIEYIKNPDTLVDNLDIPVMPARYHMAIVWRAVMYWCAHDENTALYGAANQQYQIILRKMWLSELPTIQMAGALA